jgi:hypothetical protein
VTPNNEGNVIFLRCLGTSMYGAVAGTGDLVAVQPTWWPPAAQMLFDLDDERLPPLPQSIHRQIKHDEGIDFGGGGSRCVARRRFVIVKRDNASGLPAWLEKAPLWVDVPKGA